MTTISKPGFYPNLPAEEYHADPVIEPSLSSSIGRIALDKSLEHARAKHPRLTPQEPQEPHWSRDWGSAVHRLALGAGPDIAVVDAENWKEKASQQARKAAYAAGQTPLLRGTFDEAVKAAARLRSHLTAIVGEDFDAELVAVWRERSQWCRSMLDVVSLDRRVVVDLKTTGVCVRPGFDLMRKIDGDGYDFQLAFQERGLDALDPDNRGRRKLHLLFQENEPPYATSCTEITEGALALMRKHVIASINLWVQARETGDWPGYDRAPARYEKPSWSESALLERELANPHLYEDVR